MKYSRASCSKTIAAALLMAAATVSMGFNDPVSEPAIMSELAIKIPLLSTVSLGNRIVAVGQRGHVVVSEDSGKSWKQGNVPLSNDLLAVSFPSAKQGWAVGHGGVVIHTEDGGLNWKLQLTGKQASELAVRHFEEQAKAGDPEAKGFLDKEKNLAAYGGTQPFMDVYFENEQAGYIVGIFNRIFRTVDGGKTWAPMMDKIDNPGELHFYSIRGGEGGIYLTGEQGKVWTLDAATKRFVARPTPYEGTLFGSVIAADGSVIAFGMRGAVYRSADQGRSWQRIEMGNPAGIAAGTRLANGDVVIASLAGTVAQSKDGGKTFSPVKVARPMSYFGITPLGDDRLAFVGAEGVRVEPVK